MVALMVVWMEIIEVVKMVARWVVQSVGLMVVE